MEVLHRHRLMRVFLHDLVLVVSDRDRSLGGEVDAAGTASAEANAAALESGGV